MVDKENLHRVLMVHKKFLDFLKIHTELNRRSFASKYLHFHNRNAFFIYDSIANKNVRAKDAKRKFVLPKSCAEFDKEYAGFVIRCIQYRDDMAKERHETPMTPRELDNELINWRPMVTPN